ncbi:hypothetical protein N7523_001342 [Penicillium sp. IBT 18751x]|nr:hypothetical protein N7523_001342 [Penicillium sp. IBT 18751x]
MTLIACFLLGSVLTYCLVTLIYRLHIHPLSRFPGPRLAAVTDLYEVYFSAWGAGSFDAEIAKMHQNYGNSPHTPPHRKDSLLTTAGPVVRITPDEVHVQEQPYNTSYANCWIKGTKILGSGSHQLGVGSGSFQFGKRSVSRVRSMPDVEVSQIIRGLLQKHWIHQVFNSWTRPFLPAFSLPVIHTNHSVQSDLEEGHQRALFSAEPLV